jgi:pilus assembly protein CpaB
MKNTRALMMIGVSLLAGIMAIVFAARWLNQQTLLATQKVAVASADLGLGHQITKEQVKLVDWPTGAIPTGSFHELAAVQDRVTRINILRDEPILESRLAPKGTRGGLSAVIAGGKRAITVRVNDVVGVAGFALPGNYVDVIVNTKNEFRKGDESISKIVLEKILVLAVAQEAGRDDTTPKVVNAVTLEVTPEQAEAIDLARSIGQLSLVLRNQVDMDPAATGGMTKGALLALKEPVPEKPAPRPVVRAKPIEKKTCVVAIVGNERKLECF